MPTPVIRDSSRTTRAMGVSLNSNDTFFSSCDEISRAHAGLGDTANAGAACHLQVRRIAGNLGVFPQRRKTSTGRFGVGTPEDDARSGFGRLEDKLDPPLAMKSDTGAADGVLEGSLFAKPQGACPIFPVFGASDRKALYSD